MINRIQDQIAELAPLEAIARLEQAYNQLKLGSQAPTIFDSDFGSVSFSINPRSSNKSFSHSVQATLSPEPGATPVLFAIPMFSMFLHDAANPDLLNLFPFYDQATGLGNWGAAGMKQYEHIFDLNWWMSWGRTNNSNLVAMAHVRRDDHGAIGIAEADNNPDGATSSAIAVDVFVQWRYIRPGAQ